MVQIGSDLHVAVRQLFQGRAQRYRPLSIFHSVYILTGLDPEVLCQTCDCFISGKVLVVLVEFFHTTPRTDAVTGLVSFSLGWNALQKTYFHYNKIIELVHFCLNR